MALCASAALAATPPLSFVPAWTPGTDNQIDMSQYIAGMSDLEILASGGLRVNRSAAGYAVLRKDGEILKQVPASNLVDVYTYEGMDKTEKGNLHICFFRNQSTTPAKQPGKYTVDVPAGFFTYADGTPGEAVSVNYTIAQGAEFTVWPATSPNVTAAFSAIRLTFPKGAEISYTPSGTPGAEGSTCLYMYCLQDAKTKYTLDVTVEENVLVCRFSPEASNPAIYQLDIPIGALSYKLNGKTVAVEAQTLSFDVHKITEGLEIKPEPGEYAEFPSFAVMANSNGVPTEYQAYFEIKVPDPITFVLMGTPELAPVVDGVAVKDPKNQRFRALLSSDDKCRLVLVNADINLQKTPNTLRPVPGEYALIIPKNLFSDANGRNTEMEFRFTVPVPETYDFNIEPATDKSVKELSRIVITFPDAKAISWKVGNYVNIYSAITSYLLLPTCKDNQLIIDIPSPLVEAGVYNLTAPGLFVDGEQRAVDVQYTVDPAAGPSAVDQLDGEEEYVTVYNMTGIKLLDCAERSMLEQLPAGLYIVNGRKVIRR